MYLFNHKEKSLITLLLISVLLRSLLAGWIELGNDEAYYWTFALFPDWSHYDHPAMVGWVIQAFSLNLLFDSEFFLRLSSVLFMTINTLVMYKMGKEIKDESTGLTAALLYTASLYAFAVTGIFILPDTPMSLFGLLAFWMFLRYLKWNKNGDLVLAGLLAGLCMLSKYSGVFLWVGFFLYILCCDRRQFKNPFLYLALLFSALCCLPILIWNLQNDFVSFRFQGSRAGLFGTITSGYLLKEIGGEFLYNNPVNYLIALVAVIAAFRHRLSIDRSLQRLILFTALPMIGTFLLISLTQPTLPHWSAPAFNLLILLSAVWLQSSKKTRRKGFVTASLVTLALILLVGIAEIKTGFIPLDHHTETAMIGKDDISLDLYGWRQAGEKFKAFRAEQIAKGEMKEDDAIIGHHWFPTASIDYYIARPLNLNVLGYGPLEGIHKYHWTNDKRGGFTKGADYWYLADSHYFIDPEKVYVDVNFKEIKLAGILPIERQGKIVRNIFVYECKSLVYGPDSIKQANNNSTNKQLNK